MKGARALLLLALAAVSAGCLAAAHTGVVHLTAAEPWSSDGWVYDGVGMNFLGRGQLSVDVNHRANAGELRMEVYDGGWWTLEFNWFEQEQPHHSGGISGPMTLGGATGRDGPELPETPVQAAGWGWARLAFDGQPVEDPKTKSPWLKARFLIVDGELRAPNGIIYNADRSAPYDPREPEDGSVGEGPPQAFVEVQTTDPSVLHRVYGFRLVTDP